MNPSPSLEGFFQEIEQRITGLMEAFRICNQGRQASGAADEDAWKRLFSQVFSLQTFYQKNHRALLNGAPAGGKGDRIYELLYKSSLVLDASLDQPSLLNLALDTVLEMCRCGRGFVATADEQGAFTFVTARNFQGEDIPAPELEISQTVIRRALSLNKEIQVASSDQDNSLVRNSSFMRGGGNAAICVPVLTDGAASAVIYLDQFPMSPSHEIFLLVQNFAQQLATFLKSSKEFSELKSSRQQLLEHLRKQYRFDRIIGKSKGMLQVLKMVAKVAPSDASILVQGETGTGKDLLARAIHENSHRKKAPYIEVDCGALPDNLVESELFGHAKGAFTGAQGSKSGLLEAARGGTLFLDEINHLPLASQTKLLRSLQQRSVRRIGETQERSVDFRLVVASSKSLKDLVDQGAFRQDLFYRINTVTLALPPLRKRKEDLYVLTASFLSKYAELYQSKVRSFSPAFFTALEQHPWPGNVRELEHVMERAVLLCEGEKLGREDLPADWHMDQTIEDDRDVTLEHFLNRSKKRHIEMVLQENNGKRVDAARQLGINRSYLFQLIKQLGIED